MKPKFALLATCGGVTLFGTILWIAISISKPKNLKDILNGEGKKTLDTDGTKDDADWDKLISNYLKKEKDKVTLEKISEVDIKDPKESNNQNNRKNLKNRCKKLLKTPITSDDKFKKAEEMAINWCTKSSPLLNKEQENK